MRSSWPLNAATALLLSVASTSALADERWALSLQDEAPGRQSCFQASEVANAVSARTGLALEVIATPNAALPLAGFDRVVEGRIARSEGSVALVLVLRDGQGAPVGERTLQQPEPACAALRDAAVLAIAVMMGKGELAADVTPAAPITQPEAAEPAEPAPAEPAIAEQAESAAAPSTPPDEPPPADAIAPSKSTAPTDAREDHDAQPTQLALLAGATGAVHVTPGLAPHATLGVRLQGATAWPLELSVSFLGESEQALGGASRGYATFAPVYAVLSACPLGGSAGRLRAEGCFGLLGGWARATAGDFSRRNSASTQALAGFLLTFPASLRIWGPVYVRASATVGTPFLYHRVDAIDPERRQRVLARTSPVFASGDIALGAWVF